MDHVFTAIRLRYGKGVFLVQRDRYGGRLIRSDQKIGIRWIL